MLNNVAKKYVGDKEVDAVRGAYENRARWYYYLVREGLDKGLPLEFARGAIRKLGHLYRGLYPDTDSVPEFVGAFLSEHHIKQFGMQLKSLTEDEGVIHFHYCPMLGAWTKLTCDEKEIGMICDCAMDVDRGTFDCYDHIGFRLEKAIGCGDEVCELHFYKK